jgi:hypothetical protein
VKVPTYNGDVAGIVARLDRFIFELFHSASSNTSMTNEFDQVRLKQYLTSIMAYLQWVLAQPHLDLPESSQVLILVDQLMFETDPRDLENDSLKDVIHWLASARTELLNSQSSRLPAGFLIFDATRFTAIINKVDNFLTTYIAKVDPVDLPASTPEFSMTGSGIHGIAGRRPGGACNPATERRRIGLRLRRGQLQGGSGVMRPGRFFWGPGRPASVNIARRTAKPHPIRLKAR